MQRSCAGCRLVLGVSGLLLLSGCGAAPSIELVELFEQSEIFVETGTIDLGDRAARRHLLDGWSPADERWAQRDDETFVWGRGTQASLRFYQIESQVQRMRFRGRPHAPDGISLLSTIHIRLNGVALPTPIDVVAGWQEYQVPLPARFLRVGANQLTFGFDRPASDAPSPDTTLQFAFDQVRFFDATVTALPRLERPLSEGGLILPYLSGVDFNLDLQPGAVVQIRRIQAYGRPLPEAGTLHIYVDAEGRVDHQVVTVPTTDLEIPVRIDAPARARVSMMSLPPPAFYDLQGHAAEQDAGLQLQQPVVSQPRP